MSYFVCPEAKYCFRFYTIFKYSVFISLKELCKIYKARGKRTTVTRYVPNTDKADKIVTCCKIGQYAVYTQRNH